MFSSWWTFAVHRTEWHFFWDRTVYRARDITAYSLWVGPFLLIVLRKPT